MNPRIEATDITGFTATGAAIARVTSQQSTGAASLSVDPANSVAGEGFYWTGSFSGHPEGSWLVASAEVRRASGSGGTVKIAIQNSSGTEIVASAAHTLSTSWTKLSTMYILPPHSPADYRVAVVSTAQHDITWFTDKIHVEERRDGQIADYVDGALGVNYEWTGTADASASKRRAGVSVIRGLRLKNDDGSNPVYVAFDTTATTTTGIKVVGGEIFETHFPIDFRTNISAISTGGTAAVHGVVWGIHQG